MALEFDMAGLFGQQFLQSGSTSMTFTPSPSFGGTTNVRPDTGPGSVEYENTYYRLFGVRRNQPGLDSNGKSHDQFDRETKDTVRYFQKNKARLDQVFEKMGSINSIIIGWEAITQLAGGGDLSLGGRIKAGTQAFATLSFQGAQLLQNSKSQMLQQVSGFLGAAGAYGLAAGVIISSVTQVADAVEARNKQIEDSNLLMAQALSGFSESGQFWIRETERIRDGDGSLMSHMRKGFLRAFTGGKTEYNTTLARSFIEQAANIQQVAGADPVLFASLFGTPDFAARAKIAKDQKDERALSKLSSELSYQFLESHWKKNIGPEQAAKILKEDLLTHRQAQAKSMESFTRQAAHMQKIGNLRRIQH